MCASCTLPALGIQPTHGLPHWPSSSASALLPQKHSKVTGGKITVWVFTVQCPAKWFLAWVELTVTNTNKPGTHIHVKGDKLEYPPFASCGEWWVTGPRASFRHHLLWRSTACYLWMHSYWHPELHQYHFMLGLNTASSACIQVLRYINWHNFTDTDSFPVSIHWSTSQYH